MRKKRLLFVNHWLDVGGIGKSMISLLSVLDYSKYEVDVLLFTHQGELIKLLPKEVNLLPPLLSGSSESRVSKIMESLKKGNIRLLFIRMISTFISRFIKNPDKKIGVIWKLYKIGLPNMKEHYDVVVGYRDGMCTYYVIDKVKADLKIAYNHMLYKDALQSGIFSYQCDKEYYINLDYLISVSDSSRNSLLEYFPEHQEKIVTMNNITSPLTIRQMAEKQGFEDSFEGLRIVTVSRLSEEKGIEIAIDVCKILVNKGYHIRWYVVGEGPLRLTLQKKISHLGLQDYFILMGKKINPYPYMAKSDIYVQPSKTESHGITVVEARILSCPIVVSDIPPFREQIKDGETGMISPLDPKEIANAIIMLIESPNLRHTLSKNLSHKYIGNEDEINKLYQLIN